MENQSTAKRPERSTRWIWAGFVVWCVILAVIVFATVDKLGTVPETILLPLGLVNILVVIGVVILVRRAVAVPINVFVLYALIATLPKIRRSLAADSQPQQQ